MSKRKKDLNFGERADGRGPLLNDGGFDDEDNHFGPSENEEPKEEAKAERVELPYVLEFGREVKVGSRSYTSLAFVREPTIKALKHMPADTKMMKLGHFIPIIAAMTDEATAIIEGFPASFLGLCAKIATPFLEDSETD